MSDYIDWLVSIFKEVKRVCKHNASIFVFGDDLNIAYVQVALDKFLTLLNNIVWFKVNNMPIKYAPNLRRYAPMTERILFYTPSLSPTGLEKVKHDINNFLPLREYFERLQSEIGLSGKEIDNSMGNGAANHAFRWKSSQLELPTKDTYTKLRNLYAGISFEWREYEDLRREYEDLRREYEDLRREYEDLRRTFNASSDTLDVISGPIVTQQENTKHPTTKPIYIMRDFVKHTTKIGDTVLDPFMGSGTTGIAAILEGRRFIGIEQNSDYMNIAYSRITYFMRHGDYALNSQGNKRTKIDKSSTTNIQLRLL